MAERGSTGLCPDSTLADLVASLGVDRGSAQRELDRTLSSYPGDPRLHFLKGSMLAAGQDYAAACVAMRHAVDLAPDYAVARFQLGLLLLSSGEPYAAQEAWGPLHGLATENPLRIFAGGLTHLIGDRFDDAVRELERGISLNRENVPMNNDMQLVIDEIRRRRAEGDVAFSSVDILLRQAALKSTRH
ncbi:MAG: hypothetical protein WDN01_14205 [Rhizomicrobium sp.]